MYLPALWNFPGRNPIQKGWPTSKVNEREVTLNPVCHPAGRGELWTYERLQKSIGWLKSSEETRKGPEGP